jgi:hypothetical protein
MHACALAHPALKINEQFSVLSFQFSAEEPVVLTENSKLKTQNCSYS